MPTTPLYTCIRCRKEFNFGSIKYDEKGSLVCLECLAKREKLKKQKSESEKQEGQESANFICVSCRFKFSVKKGSSKSLKCPYCGKTKLMIVKKYKDEDDLINDSMDSKFNY